MREFIIFKALVVVFRIVKAVIFAVLDSVESKVASEE